MKAYTVVGPTNVKPRRFSSLLSAVDSGVLGCALKQACGHPRGAARAARARSARRTPRASRSVRSARALAARCGWPTRSCRGGARCPGPASSRSTRRRRSARPSPDRTCERLRKASRLRRIVSQLRPGLKALEAELLEQPPVVGHRAGPTRRRGTCSTAGPRPTTRSAPCPGHRVRSPRVLTSAEFTRSCARCSTF